MSALHRSDHLSDAVREYSQKATQFSAITVREIGSHLEELFGTYEPADIDRASCDFVSYSGNSDA
jgi:hypothetical protein